MSRGDAYFARLKATLDGVVETLRAKGIDERHLAFGGEGQPPAANQPCQPTRASEFSRQSCDGRLGGTDAVRGSDASDV